MSGVQDPFGYKWWISTHIKDVSYDNNTAGNREEPMTSDDFRRLALTFTSLERNVRQQKGQVSFARHT